MSQTQASLSRGAVQELHAQAVAELEAAGLKSCQYALGLNGEVVASATIGDAPPDARYVMFSSTKAVVASVVWQLIGEGRLSVDRPVATYWPGFAKHGKDSVTVEQILVHTSGFPSASLTPAALDDRDQRVRQMEEWTLETEAGTHYAYHGLSAPWVWAELIARLDGKDHRAAIRERLLGPLGLDRLELGVPRGRQSDVQPLTPSGDPATLEEIEELLGIKLPPALAGAASDGGGGGMAFFGTPEALEAGIPGGGAVSDAPSLALFYQAVLHDPKGLWDPAVLKDATSNVRNRMTDMLGRAAFRTLGLETAGDDEKRHMRIGAGATSVGTFGHGGAGGQVAWADPVSGLSFVFLTNGIDRNIVRTYQRDMTLTRLAAQCVG